MTSQVNPMVAEQIIGSLHGQDLVAVMQENETVMKWVCADIMSARAVKGNDDDLPFFVANLQQLADITERSVGSIRNHMKEVESYIIESVDSRTKFYNLLDSLAIISKIETRGAGVKSADALYIEALVALLVDTFEYPEEELNAMKEVASDTHKALKEAKKAKAEANEEEE